MRHSRKNIYCRFRKKIAFSNSFLFGAMFFPLCITAASAVSPYLYKLLVDEVMTKGNLELLYGIIPSMIIVYCIKTIFSTINTNMNIKFANLTGTEVKRQLMEHFLYRDMNEFTDGHVGKYSEHLEKDSAAVHDFLSNHMVGYITKTVITVMYLVLMLHINPWLGLVSIVPVPATVLFSKAIGKSFNKIDKERFEVRAQTRLQLFNTIQRWREIKSNNLEERFAAQYDERLESERRLNRQWIHYFGLDEFIYMIKTDFIMKVLIYFVGGLFIIVQQITIGELLMFVSYMESMYISLDSLTKSNSAFIGQKAVYDRLFAILEEHQIRKPMCCPPAPQIELQGVTFAYETTNRKVLEDADFSFEWGKKYLLIGKSGEGKSTMIKLILGLIRPQKGEVMYHHIPIRDIDSQSIFQCVGTVMQENTFFNLTIRENLLLVAPKASDDVLMQGLRIACLNEFVDSLPQKLDTIIGERGIKLSGGQKQRLAIARLILHNPQIVILDEATNALDSLVEGKIMENLSRYFTGKTMIVISHRPLMNYEYDYIAGIENQKLTAY